MIDLSILEDFPSFPISDEFCVPELEYKGISIKEGMWATWKDSEPFRIEAIRINPTLRFWTGEDWVLANKCRIV